MTHIIDSRSSTLPSWPQCLHLAALIGEADAAAWRLVQYSGTYLRCQASDAITAGLLNGMIPRWDLLENPGIGYDFAVDLRRVTDEARKRCEAVEPPGNMGDALALADRLSSILRELEAGFPWGKASRRFFLRNHKALARWNRFAVDPRYRRKLAERRARCTGA